jgi:hypothetical protein
MLGSSTSLPIVMLKETAVSILDESKFVIVKYESLFATSFLQINSSSSVLPSSKKMASSYFWLFAAKGFIKNQEKQLSMIIYILRSRLP